MGSISVIIPLYNRAGLIVETLESIEKQTLKPYEVIIVDDRSTDDSVTVVKNYKKISGLNIIVLENGFDKGPSGALNWGIKKATGDFIAMQDSDDLWTPAHLQNLYEALNRYPKLGIAFSAVESFGNANDTSQKNRDFNTNINKCLESAFKQDSERVWVSNNDLLYTILMNGVPFRCPASLIRKEFFLNHDLFFDTDITYTQDSQFMTLASHFTPFLYVDDIGLRIRRHVENDGDVRYGDKISKSYELRIGKLKAFFLGHQISLKEKTALDHRLWSLQIYVANQKAAGKGIAIRTKTAFEFIWNVPGWSSVKSAAKLIMNLKIT